MFLQALDGSWLDHPFWKRSFLLCDEDIKKIVASGIKSVVIDTDKGLVDDTQARATGQLFALGLPTEESGESVPAVPGPAQERQPRKSVADEIEHAKRSFVSASVQIKLIFHQTRTGKAVSTTVVMPLVEAISASVIRNPHALTSVARLKRHDGYTYMYSVAVCALMTALACELELDEQAIREAGAASLMHGTGKTLMRLNVLNKPGKLTSEEFKIAKIHPEDSWKLLQSTNVSIGVLQVALHHDEKFDGRGYPHQLSGIQQDVDRQAAEQAHHQSGTDASQQVMRSGRERSDRCSRSLRSCYSALSCPVVIPAHGPLASVGNARAPLAVARVRIARWCEERGRAGRGNDAQTALGLIGGDHVACRRRRSYGGRYCHRHRSGSS
jgi:Domain of unknown function (DUF3391)/HD domain